MFKRTLIGIAGMMLLSGVLAACGNNTAQGGYSTQSDGQRVTHYAPDGYNGLTNSNPNYRIGGAPYKMTYFRDAARMKRAALNVPGVRDCTVVINGGTAYIGITVDNMNRNGQHNGHIERHVKNAVQRVVPRYSLRVTSNKSSLRQLRTVGDGLNNGGELKQFKAQMYELDERMRDEVN